MSGTDYIGASVLQAILVALAWRMSAKATAKYRKLWIEEAKRHAEARAELTEWINTAHVTAVDCAAHKTTIARLKREVTQLHTMLAEVDAQFEERSSIE